jgi:hypothetical protein
MVRTYAAISPVLLRRRPDTRLPPLLPRRIVLPPRPRRITPPPQPQLVTPPPQPPPAQPPAPPLNSGGQPRTAAYRTEDLPPHLLRLVGKDVLIVGIGTLEM